MFNLRFRAMVIGAGVCAFIGFAATGSFAQEYKTSKSCKMCHGMMHKPIMEGFAKVAHPKALADVSKNPEAIVATFDASAPIKKDQIKYTLGSGRTQQAYIDANMQILPAEWSVKDKKWVATAACDAKTQCIGCHVTGYDAAKATWAEEGVTCEACHGAGSAHASGDKTKIVNPKKLAPETAAMICGSCHSKGMNTGKTHAFPVGFKAGDDLTKFFVDAKPTTAGRNQQYSDLLTSKHFAAKVSCVTCHEPHGKDTTQPTQLKKPIVELCMGCHAKQDMKTHAPSAPAGATCATCHMPQGRHTFAKAGA